MAGSFDDADFLLPSKSLGEDDLLMGKNNLDKNGVGNGFGSSLSFPTEFPYEFDSFDPFGSSSALSSPVESVVGSTETESSDEEDFFSELTRRLPHNSALDIQKLCIPGFTHEKPENWVVAGSPQSTLSGIGSWSGRSTSGNGSPNGPSHVSSPPTTPFVAQTNTLELIYAAAGEVARLKMTAEEAKQNSNSCNHERRQLCPQILNSVPVMKKPNSGFYANQNLTQNLPQANQFQYARQEQVVRQQCPNVWGRQVKPSSWSTQQNQIQNRGRSGVCDNGRCGRALGLSQSAWPPLHAQSLNQRPQISGGSGMRAVFLNGSGVKRESTGTGVFLPCRYGNPPESRKKSGCSTVLLPAKVVQALNLSFDDMNGQAQPHFTTGLTTPTHDALMARRQALLVQQRRSMRAEGALNHEIRLPRDWTY